MQSKVQCRRQRIVSAVSCLLYNTSYSFQMNSHRGTRVNVQLRSRCRTSTITSDLLEPFAAAIRCGDAMQVDAIIDVLSSSASNVRALVNRVLDDGSTPLNVAIAFKHFDVARRLMECGSDVDLPDSFRLDGCRRKPIHYACAGGCVELVRTLIEQFSVDVDEPDDGNATPLHHAAAAGNIDVVEYLVSSSCDINARSNSGRTALWKAAQSGRREIVHLLYALGASLDVHSQVGETALFECTRRPELTEIVGDLLLWGADATTTDIERNTALHVAAAAGNVVAAECLLAAGADVNAANEYGNSALHNAVVHGQTGMVVLLLNSLADGTPVNRSGQSPLYVGLLHQRPACVRLLLDVGARLSFDELTAFHQYQAARHPSRRLLLDEVIAAGRHPVTLRDRCRAVLRQHLAVTRRQSLAHVVSRLPLPEQLRRYLLLN